MEIEFFSKVVSRYLAEFILTLASLKLLTTFLNSKLYLIILFLFYKYKLPFFVNLHSKVLNHVVFNTIHSISSKKFLRYVTNQYKKNQLSICVDGLVETLLISNDIYKDVIPKMLFYKKARFINELIQNLATVQKLLTESIRDKVADKKLNSQFAKTFLIFADTIFEVSIYRVKDLGKGEANNYQVYVNFLYVVNDLIVIFTSHIPLIVNNFVVRDRSKKGVIENGTGTGSGKNIP